MATDIADYIRRLPKAELHIHIEGSLEPELMFSLAAKHGIKLPYADVEAVRRAYEFSNLQEFLDIYYAGAAVLVERGDFRNLMLAYLKRAHADGVVHSEIFFDPQTHTARGIAMGTVIEGLTDGINEGKRAFGITGELILCFLRHLSEEDAFQTLEAAMPYRHLFIGVGLDSSEVGHPPAKFERVFARARELGLHVVAHAGEEGPPAYVTEALDLLKTERIDHGVRSEADPALCARLKQMRMPLTVCPLSNVKLAVFKQASDHNLKRLLDMGLMVTINSDDPAYFGGYMQDNYMAMAQGLNLTPAELKTLAANSISASFLPEAAKKDWLSRIEAVAA
ncbi:MAG TPA: adenosine deaminase [Burkholderiales bacterium]|nr:adenosine deaminase [Burkholderiales bacterium]